MSFTPNQRAELMHMNFHGGTTYADRDDRTLKSLEKRRLVSYQSRLGTKYGKSYWRLTTEGEQQIRKWNEKQ